MPRPAEIINGKKTFTVLENNPVVLTKLARALGLSPTVQFHDVYSLSDRTLLLPSAQTRPILALIFIIPLTPTWAAYRILEDAALPPPSSSSVLWFPQTIGHACGSIALLHSVLNGPASSLILPNSTLSDLRTRALGLSPTERAQLLYDSAALEEAHQAAAEEGDTVPPSAEEGNRLGQHFVAFLKADGRLWELEGGRKGPLDRGELAEGEDVMCERAVELGIGRVMQAEMREGGDARFSCVALVEGDEE